MLVAGAFRTAYAHSQSPLTSTRHLGHAAAAAMINTQPSAAADDLSAADDSVERWRQRRELTQHQQPTSSDVTVQPSDLITVNW